jgi:hypothetical protein
MEFVVGIRRRLTGPSIDLSQLRQQLADVGGQRAVTSDLVAMNPGSITWITTIDGDG